MSTKRGAFYASPFGGDWHGYDLYVGQANRSDLYGQVRPDAIKVRHGRCQHFGPSDDTGNSFFPWTRFLAFNAAEVAAGRPSLLITSGGHPVYFTQSLQPDAHGKPTTAQSTWYQAVNMADPRFVAWWVANYAKPIMHADALNWVGIDNGTWHYSAYCAVDAAGLVRETPRWDAPGPQDDLSYLTMVATFFATLAKTAPDIHTLVNRGTMDRWDQYPNVYSQVTGTISEELSYPYRNGSQYMRELLYRLMVCDLWSSSHGKSMILRWPYLPAAPDPTFADELRRAYVHYLLLASPQSYFNPVHGGVELDPTMWGPMAAALGDSVDQAMIGAGLGKYEGYRFYSRQTTGGVVYLNWTGVPVTVSLPSDRLYTDRAGRLVTQLKIPDMAGDYALCVPPGIYNDERRIVRSDGTVVAASDSPLEVA